jgi:hypothetical protein
MNLTVTPPRTVVCTLEEALAYENEPVVFEFMDMFDVEYEESREIFGEVKKWLWLCAYSAEQKEVNDADLPDIYVSFDFAIIDEMWHTFMLHSIAYTDFCEKYFGFYIHHTPTPPPMVKLKKSLRSSEDQFIYRITKEVYEKQLEYIYDLLGEETVVRWFDTYPEKYGMAFFKTKYVKWEE